MRELDSGEVAKVYKEIQDLGIEPFESFREQKCLILSYEMNNKRYDLVYEPSGDWFLDIIYEYDMNEAIRIFL